MIEIKRLTLLDSRIPSFPSELILCEDLKSSINKLVNNTGVPERFKPRYYKYCDYIYVALYALVKGICIHRASEKLNVKMTLKQKKKHRRRMKPFTDRKRKRRLIPHQTDVNNFLNKFTEDEAHYVFGNLLSDLNQKILKRIVGGSKMRFMVDNTEFMHYGKQIKPYDIGTVRKKGTKTCWLIQGHGLHGCGMNLFTEFRLLKKGQYRCMHIPSSVESLRYRGWNVKYSLMDREFYRASLIKDLKAQHLGVIIPAKKYKRVRDAIRDYLFFNGPLVRDYKFSQTSKQIRNRKRVYVKLVIIGKDDKSAAWVRRQYRLKKWSYDKALSQLSAFFTTLEPWSNKKRWARWLTKSYKMRWNIETGFSKLNGMHERFRNRSPILLLIFQYLRAFLYNWWQSYRKVMSDHGWRKHDLTIRDFLDNVKMWIKGKIWSSIKYNTKYGMKQKRGLYFMS